jgi:uncharacterized membrane protein YoaK (UPF0700 family)
MSTVLIAELVPLGSLLALWHLAGPHPTQTSTFVLIFCAAIAMGTQSCAMPSLHENPTTTYITGTATRFAAKLVRWLRLVEQWSTASPERQYSIMRDLAADSPWLYGLTWCVYLAGVVAGGLLFLDVSELSLLLPIAIVVIVFVMVTHPVGAAPMES